MKKLCSFLLVFLVSFIYVQAQENTTLVRGCLNTQQVQAKTLQNNPAYQAFVTKRMNEVGAILDQKNPDCSNGPLIIPVAVHFDSGVVEAGQEACMLNVVMEQLNRLNEDFAALNADIANYSNFADCLPPDALGSPCIEFCLATENHPTGWNLMDGNPAVTFADPRWDFNTFYNNVLGGGIPLDLASPDWANYLNIFVGDNNNFAFPLTGGVLGLSEGLPGDFSLGTGVFINACNFGSVPDGGTACGASLVAGNCAGVPVAGFDGGRTLVHEVGHYLGLFHIWGDELGCQFGGCGGILGGCCENDGGMGDGIADTPDMECSYQSATPSVCPGTNCADSPATCDGTPDMWFNYMAYAGDACAWMFTSDQSDVMYANVVAAGFTSDAPAACRVSACEITAFTAMMPTCSADNMSYSVDITYTGGPDASVSVGYMGAGTLGGDDPAVTMDGTITLINVPLSEDPALITFADTDGDCTFDTLEVVAPMCGLCELMSVTPAAPVCAADGMSYDVDIAYTGGPDASITVSTDAGTLGGDDPAVIPNGTISVTDIPSGTDVTITLTDADGLCMFGPFTIVDPNCPVPTCSAMAPTLVISGVACGDGTTGGPYAILDNMDGSSNAGEITEYIVTDDTGNILGVSGNINDAQMALDTLATGDSICVQAITHVQEELDSVVAQINAAITGLGIPAVFPPSGNTLAGIFNLVAGFAPAGTVITIADIEALVANGMGGMVDIGAVLGLPFSLVVDVPPFCYDISDPACITSLMCMMSTCELMNITPGMPVCAADNMSYSVDLTYTGGPDASITVTSDAGTVGGDDPAVTANGTISITNIPTGTDITVTINDSDSDCTFGPYMIAAPNCAGTCAAMAPSISINGTDCGDGTFGTPYTVVDNMDGSSNAGEITEYIILDGSGGDILGVTSNLADAQTAVDTVGIGNDVCIQAITHVQSELDVVVGELDGCAFGLLAGFLGPPPYTLEAIFNGVGGLGVALTVPDVETLLANGMGGNVDIGALIGFPGLTCDISPFCYDISAEACITDTPCGGIVCDVVAGEPMMSDSTICDGEQGIIDLTGIFMGESTGTQNPTDVSINYIAVDPTTGEIVSVTSSTDLDLSMLALGDSACVSQVIYTQATINDLVDQLNSFCIPNPIVPIPPELCLCDDILPLLGLGISCPTSPTDLAGLLDFITGILPVPLTIMQVEDFLENGIDVNDFDPTGVLPDIPAFGAGIVCSDFSNTTFCLTVEECCPLATGVTTPAEACSADMVAVCVDFDDVVDATISITVDGTTVDGSAGGTQICAMVAVPANNTCAVASYDFVISADCNGTAIDLSAFVPPPSTQVYPTDVSAFLTPVDGGCMTSITVDASCAGNVMVDAPQTAMSGTTGVHTYNVTWTGGGSCMVTPSTITANYDCCPLATGVTTPAEACANDVVQVCVDFDMMVNANISITVDGTTVDGSAGGTQICVDTPVADNTTCAAQPYDFTISAQCNGNVVDLSAFVPAPSTPVYPTDISNFLTPVDGTCSTSVTVDASCAGNVTVDAPQTAGPGEVGTHTYNVTWTGGGSCMVTPTTVQANYDCPCQGSISGIVTGDVECDGVAGEALAGMVVELQDGICISGVDCPTAMTDATGAYSFTGLDCGTYDVQVDETTLPCPQMALSDNPIVGLVITSDEDYMTEDFEFSTCVNPTFVGNVEVARVCDGNALYVVDPVLGDDIPITVNNNWTFIWSLDGNPVATIVGIPYYSPSVTGNYTVEVIDFINCEQWLSVSCTDCASNVMEIIDCTDCGE